MERVFSIVSKDHKDIVGLTHFGIRRLLTVS